MRKLRVAAIVFQVAVSLLVSAPLRAQTPVLPAGSIVNGANYRSPSDPGGAVAPGTIVSIFGSNLATDIVQSLSVPLSTKLGDTTVVFNFGGSSFEAPLYYVSSGQINAQVPFEVTGGGPVTVQIKRSTGSSDAQALGVDVISPGIFSLNAQGTGPGAIIDAVNGNIVSSSKPAHPGGILAIYCTGLGQLKTPIPSGGYATGADDTVNPVLVNIAGLPAKVLYAGAAPFFVGLYQVNVEIPSGVPAGDQPLQVIVNNVTSNTVTVAMASP